MGRVETCQAVRSAGDAVFPTRPGHSYQNRNRFRFSELRQEASWRS